MRTSTLLAIVIALAAIAVTTVSTSHTEGPPASASARSSCANGYSAETLERDRAMTQQMGPVSGMRMAGDPMWAHARDPAFLRALECQAREVESMFGRADPYQR